MNFRNIVAVYRYSATDGFERWPQIRLDFDNRQVLIAYIYILFFFIRIAISTKPLISFYQLSVRKISFISLLDNIPDITVRQLLFLPTKKKASSSLNFSWSKLRLDFDSRQVLILPQTNTFLFLSGFVNVSINVKPTHNCSEWNILRF